MSTDKRLTIHLQKLALTHFLYMREFAHTQNTYTALLKTCTDCTTYSTLTKLT